MSQRSIGVLGILLICLAVFAYVCGTSIAALNILLNQPFIHILCRQVLWYSGIPLTAGLAALLYQIFVIRPRQHQTAIIDKPKAVNKGVVAVLTAYNDEQSIGLAVADFKSNPLVKKVIVIDNNSKDRTAEVAHKAGATVYTETKPGYGQCVFRALSEGLKHSEFTHVLLCEGDMTFRAFDVEKFLAYAPHVDIVNGTRILEQLRAEKTQLSTFMYYGNFFVGKLLEIKHIGRGTFTDVGTTYKLCSSAALRKLLPRLNPEINLEFNAYFMDTALAEGLKFMECPITFHARVGESKGGNINNLRALKVGLRMILGITFGWPKKKGK